MVKDIQGIIERCKQGERNGQYQLYKLLASKLMLVAIRYLKTKPDAEDCLQEAFLKIFKNINNFKGDATIETWTTRIVINTALTKLRLATNYRTNIDIENAYFIPSALVGDSLEFQDSLILLFNLPDVYRFVFNMHAIEGYSHKEIAETLHLNETTSRSYLLRAKEMLREMHIKQNAYHYE